MPKPIMLGARTIAVYHMNAILELIQFSRAAQPIPILTVISKELFVYSRGFIELA